MCSSPRLCLGLLKTKDVREAKERRFGPGRLLFLPSDGAELVSTGTASRWPGPWAGRARYTTASTGGRTLWRTSDSWRNSWRTSDLWRILWRTFDSNVVFVRDPYLAPKLSRPPIQFCLASRNTCTTLVSCLKSGLNKMWKFGLLFFLLSTCQPTASKEDRLESLRRTRRRTGQETRQWREGEDGVLTQLGDSREGCKWVFQVISNQ